MVHEEHNRCSHHNQDESEKQTTSSIEQKHALADPSAQFGKPVGTGWHVAPIGNEEACIFISNTTTKTKIKLKTSQQSKQTKKQTKKNSTRFNSTHLDHSDGHPNGRVLLFIKFRRHILFCFLVLFVLPSVALYLCDCSFDAAAVVVVSESLRSVLMILCSKDKIYCLLLVLGCLVSHAHSKLWVIQWWWDRKRESLLFRWINCWCWYRCNNCW